MAEDNDWRHVRLPDGRTVEYVDAVLIDRDGDRWLIDVVVLVDGVNVSTHRVSVLDTREVSS